VRSPALALPAALVATLLAGCAGSTSNKSADDFQGDQKAVAQVIDDLGNAGSKRDAKEICNTIFSRSVADKLKSGNRDCEDVVKDQLKDASDFDMTVKKVTVAGNDATASVQSQFNGDDTLRTLSLVKAGNAWRIASIATPAG
jgi:hypothetical protein